MGLRKRNPNIIDNDMLRTNKARDQSAIWKKNPLFLLIELLGFLFIFWQLDCIHEMNIANILYEQLELKYTTQLYVLGKFEPNTHEGARVLGIEGWCRLPRSRATPKKYLIALPTY